MTESQDKTREERLELFRQMLCIRRFEEKAARLRAKGLIPGFLHPYIGQEAVAVGICDQLQDSDVLTSTHRGHGHMLARGAEPRRMYAELYARKTGYNGSKGGSLHMIDRERGFLGANGIVGGGIPLATGAALQLHRQKSEGIAVTFFGDGATNEGSFHESLNLASLWKLPILYVCENNLYGEFTRQDQHQSIKDIADRAASYGMTGVIADGNDVEEMSKVAAAAAARARKGEGPTLIEAKTYRHRGHFEGDMAKYRPKDEVEHWMSRDPIDLYSVRLIEEFSVSEDELQAVRDAVEKQLGEAAEWANEQPYPDPSESTEDVYVDNYEGAALR